MVVVKTLDSSVMVVMVELDEGVEPRLGVVEEVAIETAE